MYHIEFKTKSKDVKKKTWSVQTNIHCYKTTKGIKQGYEQNLPQIGVKEIENNGGPTFIYTALGN